MHVFLAESRSSAFVSSRGLASPLSGAVGSVGATSPQSGLDCERRFLPRGKTHPAARRTRPASIRCWRRAPETAARLFPETKDARRRRARCQMHGVLQGRDVCSFSLGDSRGGVSLRLLSSGSWCESSGALEEDGSCSSQPLF